MSVILGQDDPKTLDRIVSYGDNRNITWEVDNVNEDSKLWGTFPNSLQENMTRNGIALHAHTYSVSFNTYNNTPGLKDFMKITQSDTLVQDGETIKFINSMEGRDYPVYLIMYHPEYQLLQFYGQKQWNLASANMRLSQITDEIAFRISLKLNRDARLNRNHINKNSYETNQDFFEKWGASRVPPQTYPMVSGLEVMAYGYN